MDVDNPARSPKKRGGEMRVLFWYCDTFAWNPTIKTLDDAPDATASSHEKAVVAFIHVEPKDIGEGSVETKLVKNAKWVARKWETRQIILHSFTHLGEEKADPESAKLLIDRVAQRLESAEYEAIQTPYGYFHDLTIQAQGHPLARIFKEF
ncbi:MAG: hypothetical protein JEZ11_26070 [Desulfobacterales bacterium]|nr:hypothetical protein [Desulfobacterales bacterium]